MDKFLIEQKIGSGGMGAVYEAEQAHPHRRVAVKLVRADRLSDAMLRRFAVESEVLGRLQHAGIARIYEAGTAVTPFGAQPFFPSGIEGQLGGFPVPFAPASRGRRTSHGRHLSPLRAAHRTGRWCST
jgi:hypothetical protein